jgi:hypothetical protein
MNIHMNHVNLAKYGTGVCHMAVRIYNRLPNKVKAISNDLKKFKVSLKEFLCLHFFIHWMTFLRDKDVISM